MSKGGVFTSKGCNEWKSYNVLILIIYFVINLHDYKIRFYHKETDIVRNHNFTKNTNKSIL